MFCPICLYPNPPAAESCVSCGAGMAGLRNRVALGAQFLFIDASARRPVAMSLDGEAPKVFVGPVIISRHRHSIGLGDGFFQPGQRRAVLPAPEVHLPRLSPPAGPDLLAAITDRKIYRPKEQAQICIVAPGAAGTEVEMEVQLAGQTISKAQVVLDDAGLALRPFADLEEGEYTVVVRRRGSEPARCTFSVAEFTLSPLIARLEQHTYDATASRLSFRLHVLALSVPYSGPAELGLQSASEGGRVVASSKVRVRDGSVERSFDVKGYGGPFRVQLTTPDGRTASVFFPGTGQTERERITICPLGRVAEAGLLPGEDTQEVRGLHIGYDGVENTPLRLESAIGATGRVIADVAAGAMQVVTFHPLTGKTALHERGPVMPGDAIEFPVDAPYTLFTAGVLAPRQPYEAWGVVIRPGNVQASLLAPATATPGAEIGIRIESDRPAACLLLVYDARLEHESPVPKLGKRTMDALRAAIGELKEQTAPPLPQGYPPSGPVFFAGMGPEVPGAPLYRAMATPGTAAMMGTPSTGALDDLSLARERYTQADTATAVEPITFVAVPSREDFAELAYLELFPVRGAAERTVRLGDQIGAWRCRAYLAAGLDFQELTADVEVDKPVYAELDLPAIAGEGDDILASVHYHTRGPATMTLTLPDGRTVSGAVMGHGAETFRLTGSGEVAVHIAGAGGEDWTRRTVSPPGVQSVTASRLDILHKGETIRAARVVVYPGPGDVLKDTIEALGRYPFG